MTLVSMDIEPQVKEIVLREKGKQIVFTGETAAYIQNNSNSFRTNINYVINEDGRIPKEDMEYVGYLDAYITTPLRTFCDILEQEEFLTGQWYEICVKIYELFANGKVVGYDENYLYSEAVRRVGKELVEDNWEDLKDFYVH